MAERPPAARHAGVLRYCGYRERSNVPFARLEVPSGVVTVIFSFGDSIAVNDATRRSFVAPLHEEPATTRFLGRNTGSS